MIVRNSKMCWCSIEILQYLILSIYFTVCFKIFDHDHDGILNQAEVLQLIGSLKDLEVDQNIDSVDSPTVSFEMLKSIPDGSPIHLELFLIWAVQENSLKHLLDLLHQVIILVQLKSTPSI